MSEKRIVETCLSPALYDCHKNNDAIVVVIDILRATASIVTAFMNGAQKLIPVGTLDEAREYKSKGFMVAAERDGIKRDFADFGNSPYNFTKERVANNDIVYSTTNGTNTIMLAKEAYRVAIGAYLNITALKDYIVKEQRDLVLLCAGWKNRFNLEDTLFAGALAQMVLEEENYTTICDSTHGAMDLWDVAKVNLMGYIDKAAQRSRLRKNGLDDVIEYCHELDKTSLIPVLENNYIVELNSAKL